MERKLRAKRRAGSGKGAARKLRAAQQVPGVLYGRGIDPIPLAVDARDLYHVLHTEAGANVLVDLHVDGKRHLALPREVQRDHVRGQVLHVDFMTVRRDEKITVGVPVRLVGESRGVKEGGVLEHHLWEVQVECLPGDVPEAVEADISALGIGDGLRVSDLSHQLGVTITTDPGETVVSVVPPPILRVEEVAPEEVEAAVAPAEGEGAPEAAVAGTAAEEAEG